MFRRIFLVSLVIISVIGVYSLTRPANKPPLNIQKELQDSQSAIISTTSSQFPEAKTMQTIAETNDTVASLSISDRMVMVENELVSAKTELKATTTLADKIELDIFIHAAEDILNIPNFSQGQCDRYKKDFMLKYYPNDSEPMSSGTEKAYRLLEELCS